MGSLAMFATLMRKMGASVAIMYGVLLALPAHAIETGLNATAEGAGLKADGVAAKTPAELVGSILGAALALVGIVFLVIMIYGGFTWMTAEGDKDKIEKARGLIVNGVIGMIVIAAAYIITNFVLTSILSSVL